MTDNYSILTNLSADEVAQTINKNPGKKSIWEFINKIQFEGKVENNQIKLDTIQMPYVRFRGEISDNQGGTILNLKIHTDDNAKSAYLLVLVYSFMGFI